MNDQKPGGDLTDRVHTAAAKAARDPHATSADIADAACREVAAWLAGEAALHAAQVGARIERGTDYAHHSAINQIADRLHRVGNERHPS